jgi:hypothetical protein
MTFKPLGIMHMQFVNFDSAHFGPLTSPFVILAYPYSRCSRQPSAGLRLGWCLRNGIMIYQLLDLQGRK